MRLSYRAFALIAATGCLGLSLVWLLAPQLLLSLWGVQQDESVRLVGRRTAALFLGIGVMFFVARNAEASVARQALLAGFGIGCAALAALGLFELAMGRVGAGIFVAVVTELLAASACLTLVLAKPGSESKFQLQQRQAQR